MFIPDGLHIVRSSLLLGDNMHLHLGRNAIIQRELGGTGDPTATIRNRDIGGNVNIRVSGGTLRTVDDTWVGRHLAFLKVDYLTVDNVRILGVYEDWNTHFHDCQFVTISNVVINSGTELYTDGLHFSGGRWITVVNCNITCGDDCLAFSNTEAASPGMDLTDVTVANCTLHSLLANPIRILVGPEVEDPEYVPRAVRRVRIANIVAKAGTDENGGGLPIQNLSGVPGLISDIEYDGVTFDAIESNVDCVNIQFASKVRLHRVVVRAPAFRIAIDGSSSVELDDCVVDSPRQANSHCVLVAANANCADIRIIGGAYLNATHNAIQFGTSTLFVNGFEVRGALIAGNEITTLVGVYVWTAVNGLVSNNTIKDCTSWGIFEDPSLAADNLFLGNRLFNNTLGPISFGGANSQAIRNVAEATVEVADSGGFRQTIDGWTIATTAASGTEMDRWGIVPQGQRFRAARNGSITGLVLECPNSISSGTVTVTVWRNTGIPGATTGLTNTGYSISLSSGTKTSSTQPLFMTRFDAQDELFLVYTFSGSPTTTVLRCSFEVSI